MKYTLIYILSILLSVGTLAYSAETLEVYYSTMQEENETGHGFEKHPETDKLTTCIHKYVHFSDEFSEKQYFILHHNLHNEGYTSSVDLPPEA